MSATILNQTQIRLESSYLEKLLDVFCFSQSTAWQAPCREEGSYPGPALPKSIISKLIVGLGEVRQIRFT